MTETSLLALEAKVFGRVQGVGFRYSARQRAVQLKLTGWVRNEPDGSVTVHCEGPAGVLEEYLKWLDRGPPGAVVSRIDKRFLPARGTFRTFSIEY